MEPSTDKAQKNQVTVEAVRSKIESWEKESREIIALACECPDVSLRFINELTTLIAGTHALKETLNRPSQLFGAAAFRGLSGGRCLGS
jgi:hypothetical protein